MAPAEHRQLMPPRIPTFGKAMKEDDEVVARTAFGVMQANLAHVCEPVLDSELALRLHSDPTDRLEFRSFAQKGSANGIRVQNRER
jgi:hypothetical protein